MLGRDLKAWAATVPDAAVIEIYDDRYVLEWIPLEPMEIRANVNAALTMAQVCNLEDIRP